MGNTSQRTADPDAGKVIVEWDQPSRSCPGMRSVISQPLDDFLDFDTLWGCLIKTIKEPPLVGMLSGCSWEDISEHEFMCRHTFSVGQLGHFFGFEDFETTEKNWHDSSKGELITQRFDAEGTLIQTTTTRLHKGPLQVEAWTEMPEYRSASRMIAVVIAGNIAKSMAVLGMDPNAMGSITVNHEVDSLSGSGLKSVVSDPLDDYFDNLDQLWDAWLKQVKLGPKADELLDTLKGKSILNTIAKDFLGAMPTVSSFEVREISATEFTTITVVDGESLVKALNFVQRMFTPVDAAIATNNSGDSKTVMVHIVDRSKAELQCQIFNDYGILLCETFTRFYEDPLRVEAWVDQAPDRGSGRVLCIIVWTFLHEILKGLKSVSNDCAEELLESS